MSDSVRVGQSLSESVPGAGDLPAPGIKLRSPTLQGKFLTIWASREAEEYWSWLPFPPPGDLPDPGIKPTSPALQTDSFPSEVARRQPKCLLYGLPWWLSGKVQSLGREDPLEKEMATHSSTLPWKIPWTEEPGRLYCSRGRKESDTTERLEFTSL